MQKILSKLILLTFSFILSVSYAENQAPVEDLSQNTQSESAPQSAPPANNTNTHTYGYPDNTQATAQPTPPSPPLPMDQRVGRLENQMSNLVQMNLPQQMTQLQQTLQQLQGQIQEQQHTIKTLELQ